jgi:LemA protein
MASILKPGVKLTLVGLGLIVIILLAWVVVAYNSLVAKDQNVSAQWAQVENQMQRKFDLIPQLVAVSEDYQEFERFLLENLTKLRSQWANRSGIPRG